MEWLYLGRPSNVNFLKGSPMNMQRQLQETRDRLAKQQREQEAAKEQVRKGMQQLVKRHEKKLLDYIMRIRGDRAAIDKLLAEIRKWKPTDSSCRCTIDGKPEDLRGDAVQALQAKYPKFFGAGDITCLKKWWQFWK
jgi:hypothetical protein